jgi:hypothetical protein
MLKKVGSTNFIISYTCLDASIIFHHLKKTSIVILTSGSLSPLDQWESELGMKFYKKKSFDHVISQNIGRHIFFQTIREGLD